jgi:glycosyltransferase involved in cell wall biosynthesis
VAEDLGEAIGMMRLAWCGPWNDRSAIASFGQFIVAEMLARNHEVTVFRTEAGEPPNEKPLPASIEVKNLDEENIEALGRSFDGVVANIGNHYPFHGSLIQLLERVPCLVIFHDGLIADLAAGWAYHAGAGESSLRTLVRQLYGEGAWKSEEPYWDWGRAGCLVSTRPMTEWLTPLAAGIVTHSAFWASRSQAACSGKVDIVPLAFPDFGVAPPQEHRGKLVIGTIGHVNPNKRADQVLRAIASDPVLRDRCEYRLLGPIADADRERLVSLSAELGIPPPRFTGWLSDEDLKAAIAEVDVISCLRYPVIEAGSASLVTAMYTARPTLVSWHGAYAEVPDHTVLPCAPGHEAADVAAHLRQILAEPAAALARGQRARAHALKFHSAAYYVDRLLPAIEAATAAAPAIGAAFKLGKILGDIGVSADNSAVSRVSRNLSEMLADSHRN